MTQFLLVFRSFFAISRGLMDTDRGTRRRSLDDYLRVTGVSLQYDRGEVFENRLSVVSCGFRFEVSRKKIGKFYAFYGLSIRIHSIVIRRIKSGMITSPRSTILILPMVIRQWYVNKKTNNRMRSDAGLFGLILYC